MLLNGKQVLNAARPNVWEILMNPEVLAKLIPGVSKLEKIDEHQFRSFFTIKLGPVNGSFTGNLQLEDVQAPREFTLKIQQNSKIGNANAAVKIELTPISESQTQISFEGDAKLSGMLAGMGQRLLGGVANTLTKQFFSNLEKEIELHPN